jgi:hypothetical protein
MPLSAALNVAAKRGLLVSPAIHAASPPRRDEPKIPTLPADEVDPLLAAALSDPREAHYVVAPLLGAREGELLALTWENAARKRDRVGVANRGCRSASADGHSPGECTVREIVGGDRGGFDRLHLPPITEAGLDLVLGNPPGSPVARLAVTEAQHVNVTARRKNGPKAVDVPDTVIVVKDMKESAVKHVFELFVEVRQLKGVPNEEPGGQASVAGFALRDGDRCLGRVDAGGLVAEASGHEGMLSGPTAYVQHSTAQNASLSKFKESRLRSADVPRGCAGIGRIEVLVPRSNGTRHTIEGLPVVAHARCVSRYGGWQLASISIPFPKGLNDPTVTVVAAGVSPRRIRRASPRW